MSALRHIKGYQDRGRPFSCWLYRIAVNAIASHYRNQRSQVSLDDELGLCAGTADPVDVVVERARVHAVWIAVGQLPRQPRYALVLKFEEEANHRSSAQKDPYGSGEASQQSEAAESHEEKLGGELRHHVLSEILEPAASF